MPKVTAVKVQRLIMVVGPNGPMARHGWQVTLGGKVKGALTGKAVRNMLVEVTQHYRTKEKALTAALKTCRAAEKKGQIIELKIKDRTGTIRDGRTFGKDPRRIKG